MKIFIVVYSLCFASTTLAGTCQSFLQSSHVQHHQGFNNFATGHDYRYRVQPHIEFQAQQTYSIQRDTDFLEFMQLYSQYKAFKAGQQSGQFGSVEANVQPVNPVTKHCGSCHSGPTPADGRLLDPQHGFDCDNVVDSIEAIRAGRMPKNTQLSQQEKDSLIDYLLANRIKR